MPSSIADKLLALVDVPSVTGHERALCDFLLQRLPVAACTVTRVGDSFALYPRQRAQRPLVALVGHLDTVPPGNVAAPRRDDARVWGPGAADMKSGLAVMWQLLETPVTHPAYDVAYLFYTGEEGTYEESGLPHLIEALPWRDDIALAFCLEPSDNVLQLGCLGNIHAELSFQGRAAHSARPWQGENAVHKAARLLGVLAAIKPRAVTLGDLVYHEVISVTLAHGGVARNVVPEHFSLNLNYRFSPQRSLDDAQAEVLRLVGSDATVSFVDLSPAGPIPRDNPVLTRFRQVCPVPVTPKQAWTDVARLASWGIAAVNFGPGESAQAHQLDESTAIALLIEGEALFRRFLTADAP